MGMAAAIKAYAKQHGNPSRLAPGHRSRSSRPRSPDDPYRPEYAFPRNTPPPALKLQSSRRFRLFRRDFLRFFQYLVIIRRVIGVENAIQQQALQSLPVIKSVT